MIYQFELMQRLRKHVLNILNAHSDEELYQIPTGFSNNLLWNAAHIVVTQQLLHYRLSGLDTYLSDDFIGRFCKGSSANGLEIAQKEITFVKEKLIELPQLMVQDYEKGIFKTYKTYPTSYKVTLHSIEEAIHFNNAHENLHLGYMMAMRKRLTH